MPHLGVAWIRLQIRNLPIQYFLFRYRGFFLWPDGNRRGMLVARRLYMRSLSKLLTSTVLAAAFVAPVIITGCAARVSTGYTYHDGYYNDDHVWDSNEVAFYGRWENDTHRNHKDFRKRDAAEQKEYMTWRHNQH
jgi:hypothetical protein